MSTDGRTLSTEDLAGMDAWWRAANYLSAGQIYLMENPLLKQPLTPQQIKPRLLGHWGTTPGLNFIYVHLNRAINERDLNMIYIIGPGHGGPAMVANTWMEGSYSQLYPDVTMDEEGMGRFSSSSPSPAGFRATWLRRSRGAFTRGENSATPCPTPSGRLSTTRT
jgi:xylulose-5-phosphate/fructose-6-phosphate phosphoketolase